MARAHRERRSPALTGSRQDQVTHGADVARIGRGMEPTRRDYDADLLTVVYAWADNDATADELLGAVILHQEAIASLPPTPTPHRSPEGIGLERGAVGVSLAEDKP